MTGEYVSFLFLTIITIHLLKNIYIYIYIFPLAVFEGHYWNYMFVFFQGAHFKWK